MLLKILGNVQKDSGKISRRFRRMLQMFRRIVKRILGNVNFHEIFLVFIKICCKLLQNNEIKKKKKLPTNSSEKISSPLLLTTKILSLIFIIDLFRSLFLFLLFGIKVFAVTRSRVSKNPK